MNSLLTLGEGRRIRWVVRNEACLAVPPDEDDLPESRTGGSQ